MRAAEIEAGDWVRPALRTGEGLFAASQASIAHVTVVHNFGDPTLAIQGDLHFRGPVLPNHEDVQLGNYEDVEPFFRWAGNPY